jgi:hypothetical protein
MKRTISTPGTSATNTQSPIDILKSITHNPYGPEDFNMRNLSILLLQCYGFIYLFIKLILSSFNSKNSFFTKMVNNLLKQSYFYFLFLSFIYLLYSFGALDSIKENWQYVLAGIGILGIYWIISNIWIIIFSNMIVKKWEILEENAKSFCKKLNYY